MAGREGEAGYSEAEEVFGDEDEFFGGGGEGGFVKEEDSSGDGRKWG